MVSRSAGRPLHSPAVLQWRQAAGSQVPRSFGKTSGANYLYQFRGGTSQGRDAKGRQTSVTAVVYSNSNEIRVGEIQF